ncbi:protein root UVB sensitive 5 [Selaginella moellendorffii]|uniref:protein root UVB sensitive 5 n=1 Tax=Selaginella moellendorffii TaxID=88036 RepID=UPI000D1C9AF9|nr:protein root UVB sensitive 5 [Selaginella moellendorffii]|eukprot:XP_024531511.1 protein root UVB sensitive 5 [Selaginella moellendorffii]
MRVRRRSGLLARASDSTRKKSSSNSPIAASPALPGSVHIEERIASKNLVHSFYLDEKSWHEIGGAAAATRDESARWRSNFFLPAGFPGSVSQDYLQYMLWQLPTNITGWICRALITSSLLQAVGLSTEPGSAAAASAAIKWVTKDGLGAVGRLFIGGRFGGVFDEDPKQWRLYAEVIGSFGGLFELATPLAPDYFLLLASLGHLTKAVARGLKDPSFRVIQNHFAISENVGDVAAKEEVWEVAGQLIGLSLGVVLLSTPVVATSYSQLALSWMIIRSFHLWLRYQTLAALELPTMNFKRLNVLIMEHIQGRPLSGVGECNKKENLILPYTMLMPQIRLGCSLREVITLGKTPLEIEEAFELYNSEKYVLIVFSKSDMGILLKDGCENTTLLRSIYQAHVLFHSKSFDTFTLKQSLTSMQKSFASFLDELVAAGWNPSKLVVKVPSFSPTYTLKANVEERQQ